MKTNIEIAQTSCRLLPTNNQKIKQMIPPKRKELYKYIFPNTTNVGVEQTMFPKQNNSAARPRPSHTRMSRTSKSPPKVVFGELHPPSNPLATTKSEDTQPTNPPASRPQNLKILHPPLPQPHSPEI